MQSTIKELRVQPQDWPKHIIFQAKEMLLNETKLNIVSGTNSSVNAASAVEKLIRFGYVTYDNVRTETLVINNKRMTRLVITVKKTNDFDKLYKENEENRKKKMEEREKQENKP